MFADVALSLCKRLQTNARTVANPPDEHSPVTDQRIEEILDLIRRGKWRIGKSVQECADRWGVGRQRVYQLVGEANKLARMEIGAKTALTIQRTLTTVAKRGRLGAMPGDLSAAVQASVALTKIAGWDQPLEKAPEQSTNGAPPTITVTYHASVAPPMPKDDNDA